MKLSRYYPGVFRASLIFLVCILILGAVVAFLPSGSTAARSGVTLRGVKFNLYPEQDQCAVWRFQAKQVTIDPLRNVNTLDGLGQGGRWLIPKDGPERLDLTLQASRLVIDSSDNLSAQEAKIYIPDGCYSLDFRASGEQAVLIDQRSGITAPSVDISAPGLNLGYDDFSGSFDLTRIQGSQRPGASAGTRPDTVCKAGRIVKRPS